MAKVVTESSQANQDVPVYEQDNFEPKLFKVPELEGVSQDDMSRFGESLLNFGLLSGKLICITFANARQSFMGKVDKVEGNELKLVSTSEAIEAKPILLTKGTTIELLQRSQKYGYMELLEASNGGKFHGKTLKELGPHVGRLLHGLPVKGEWERKDGKEYFGEVKLLRDTKAKGRKIFSDTNERTPVHMENVLAELRALGFEKVSFDYNNKENGIRLTESASINLRGGKAPSLNIMEAAGGDDYEKNPDRYHNALLVVQGYVEKNNLRLTDLEEKVQKQSFRLGVKIDDAMWEEIKNNPKGVRVDFEFENKAGKEVAMPGRLYIDAEMNQLKHRFLTDQEIRFEQKQATKQSEKIEDAVVIADTPEVTMEQKESTERKEYVTVLINAVKELKTQGYKEAWFDVKNPEAGIALDGKKTFESQGYIGHIRFETGIENLKSAHVVYEDKFGVRTPEAIQPEVGNRLDKALNIVRNEVKKFKEGHSTKESEQINKGVKNTNGVKV